MSETMRNIAISLVTALAVPTLAMLLILVWQGADVSVREFQTALLIFGPFTLAGSFLIVWPTYALLRRRRSELSRIAGVLGVSTIAGVAMLIPFSERLPWEGAVFALATAGLWLSLHRLSSGSSGEVDSQELQGG